MDVFAASGDYAIPLAAFLVSAAALIYGVFGSGRWSRMSSFEQAQAQRISDLTAQVRQLREENKECARRVAELRDENLTMLRRIAKMENGHR